MKLYYISSNSWGKKAVDTNQTLNSINSLGEHCDVTFYSSFISRKSFQKCLSSFIIKNINFVHKRIPIYVSTKIFIIEKITRLLFCIYITLVLIFKTFEIIYTRDFSYIYFISFLPRFLRPKQRIIFEAHKVYYKTSKKVNFEQENKALSIVDLFIANSIGTKEGLISNFGIDEKRVLVLNNGVNLEAFNKKKVNNTIYEKYKINKNNKIIIYTGSFQDWKGVDVLIDAAGYLKINNFKLLLIGGYGKDKDRINEVVKKSKYSEKIYLDEYLPQSELLSLLSIADIAIIPNKFTEEGEKYTSPVKAFEYMAMGLPIIASKLPSMMGIFKESINCLFFAPEDPRDLANKIEILLNDRLLSLKISKNNLEKSKQFSWDSRAKKLIDFIRKSF